MYLKWECLQVFACQNKYLESHRKCRPLTWQLDYFQPDLGCQGLSHFSLLWKQHVLHAIHCVLSVAYRTQVHTYMPCKHILFGHSHNKHQGAADLLKLDVSFGTDTQHLCDLLATVQHSRVEYKFMLFDQVYLLQLRDTSDDLLKCFQKWPCNHACEWSLVANCWAATWS